VLAVEPQAPIMTANDAVAATIRKARCDMSGSCHQRKARGNRQVAAATAAAATYPEPSLSS
jgi:hypothetical protein